MNEILTKLVKILVNSFSSLENKQYCNRTHSRIRTDISRQVGGNNHYTICVFI